MLKLSRPIVRSKGTDVRLQLEVAVAALLVLEKADATGRSEWRFACE